MRGIKLRRLSPVLALCILLGLFLALPSPAAAAKKRFAETLCESPGYHCVKAGTHEAEKRGKKVKVKDTWESLFPDEREREIVRRLNRTNLKLKPGQIIAVPDDMNGKNYMDFAPFPKSIADECIPVGEPQCRMECEPGPEGKTVFRRICEQECAYPDQAAKCGPGGQALREKVLIFDPKLLAWGAYDEYGNLVNWGPAAGGADWCADIGRRCRTASGEFRVFKKKGRWAVSGIYPLDKEGKPKGGAPMPWFMEFHNGMGFHGSPNVPGYNASHGCVRLYTEDAEWLNKEFVEIGTRVIVKSYEQ